MKFKSWMLSFGLIIILAASLVGHATPVQATTVTGNVFLQGTYAEIGIGPNGTFGSIVAAPAGFHPHGPSNHLGFVADFQKDGWTVGTPPFGGDYFTPGTPWEGFGVACNAGASTAQNLGGSPSGAIAPVSLVEGAPGPQLTADWIGTVSICGSTLQITHHYYMNPSWTYIMVDTTILNTGSSTIPTLTFGRGVDPDNDQSWPGGSFTTTNHVVNQPGSIPDTSNTKAIVTAYGTLYPAMGLILGTDDARARANAQLPSFGIYNALTLSSPTVGPVTSDVAIQIAYALGDLAAGNSVHVTYFYGFNAPDVGVPGPGPTPVPTEAACVGSKTTITGGSATDGPWTLTVPATAAPTGSCVSAAIRDASGEPPIGTGVRSLGHFAQGSVVAPDGSDLHSFTPALTICYHYTDADLAASGYNPNNISLGTEDDGVHWTMLAANADPATKTICAKTSQLSYFGLFLPARLPATGFAPNRVTNLPLQTTTYQQMGDVWLEIPRLAEQINVVGVPFSTDGWDISWLGGNAGWLENTALPGVAGNSVLTGHVTDALGQPGPFASLNQMWYGDRIILHAWGQQYNYEVRSVRQVAPDAVASVMTHKELSWLTLLTCKGFNDSSNSYTYRVAVQAVLVQVK
jgi:LPXTG-site transpeptidase (sortase) family protein